MKSTTFRNGTHSRWMGVRREKANSGDQRGALGAETSRIPVSSGRFPPFLLLQGMQLQTMFSQLVFPPWERGTT